MNSRCQILVFMAVMCAGMMVYAQDCTPSCVATTADTRECLPPGSKIPDPMNCTQYYYCLANCEPMDHAVPCPPGDQFDPVAGACAPAAGDCPTTCSPATCHLACNGTYDLISDPADCSKYFVCLAGGIQGPLECKGDAPYFNGKMCVASKTECCEGSCIPFCTAEGIEVPDPNDCKKFYICIAIGKADEALHFDCPSGETFDVALGRCTKDAECVITCKDGLPTTASPVTTTSATTSAATTTAAVTSPPSTTAAVTSPPSTTAAVTSPPSTTAAVTSPASTTAGGGGSSPASTTAGGGGSSPGSTIAVTTAAPSTVTPTSECVESIVCTAVGRVPACSTCQPNYFDCPAAGQPGEPNRCTGDLVFNPVPDYPFCILAPNCPYHPPM